MQILRVDEVQQQELCESVIGILNDMVHVGLGYQKAGIVVQVIRYF